MIPSSMLTIMKEEAKLIHENNLKNYRPSFCLLSTYINNELLFVGVDELLKTDDPNIIRINKNKPYIDYVVEAEKLFNVHSHQIKRYLSKTALDQFCVEHPYSGIEYYTKPAHSFTYSPEKYIYMYLKYPYIEKMIKCPALKGITEEMIYNADIDANSYHICFKDGKNIDEITGLKNYQWTAIGSLCGGKISVFRNLKDWTIKENLSKEDFDNIRDINLMSHKVNKIRKIIIKRFNKKRIFTTSTLLNYLRRIDAYQAIGSNEAVDILYDYLTMCYQMKIAPVLDTDSLKREHDVCARNFRLFSVKKASELKTGELQQFEEVSKRLQSYEWTNDGLSAIAPHTPKDIIEEGINNRNCVGSYLKRFTQGRTKLFFIRKVENLKQSYITIELTDDLSEVDQAYYSSNRTITSQKDLKFIKNWLKHIQEINNTRP